MSQYPDPEHINLPSSDEIGGDQQYAVGWTVQHNRLWAAVAVLGIVIVILAGALVSQSARFRPTVQYVTLQGGLVAVWNELGEPVIDSVTYQPIRFRRVVRDFAEARYAYDWQNPSKFNSALHLMSDAGRRAELEKIQALRFGTNVVATRTKYDLQLDYDTMDVVAEGRGRFRVTLAGDALITDAVRHTDPINPFRRRVEIELTIETAEPSMANPLGYQVVSTGRDIL